jgi:hypothetical protein
MQRVLRGLEARGVELTSLHALELFGGTGTFHTVDFATRVGKLEVWEMDPKLQAKLEKNLPRAIVRIVDSYAELKRTEEKFDLIVVDNPMSTWSGHCEHFDLLPGLFRVAADEAVFVLDVIPSVPLATRRKYPYLFNEEQCFRRREFYKTEDAENLSWQQILPAYQLHAEKHGFVLRWSFITRRHFIYYLTLKINRQVVPGDSV